METKSCLSYWKSVIANFSLVSLKHKQTSDLETLTTKTYLGRRGWGKSQKEKIFLNKEKIHYTFQSYLYRHSKI